LKEEEEERKKGKKRNVFDFIVLITELSLSHSLAHSLTLLARLFYLFIACLPEEL
jgi:hypothetical protein